MKNIIKNIWRGAVAGFFAGAKWRPWHGGSPAIAGFYAGLKAVEKK